MAEFTERDEAFFRSGDQLVVAPDEPRATWWRRLFRPELRGWSPPFEEPETADYASYELIFEHALELAA